MILSDISVTRPVLAAVLSLLLIAFGLLSFDRLPLREYPDIDPPVVSVETIYPGAAANVVETRITELIEDRVAGIEGIRFTDSKSEDGRSVINIEFSITRDVDAAANDIRDRVSTVLDDLPGVGPAFVELSELPPAFLLAGLAGVLVSLTDPKGRARVLEVSDDLDDAAR